VTGADPARGADLTVVGMGISVWDHVTPQTLRAIEGADEVLYLTPNPLTERWIEKQNPNTASLGGLYQEHEQRAAVYDAVAERILSRVRRGHRVCVAVYGHPGVYVDPTRFAIERARNEGFTAVMLPAISAADCLYADIGFDPGALGCQSYEATAFLERSRPFDTATPLVLWQIGGVGESSTTVASPGRRLGDLVDLLSSAYGGAHEVVVYEAADTPFVSPRVDTIPLRELADATLSLSSTLYVPELDDSRPAAAKATASS
jgi:uncharacterized protein YabN with tetrapyrrole methylase and pyrophosphatase domain